MFPRNYKLPLRSIPEFFDEAQKFQSGFVTVFFRAEHPTQVVVIVPKRVAPLATHRNALQRKFYAALMTQMNTLEAQRVQLCIVVQRKITSEQVQNSIFQLIKDLQKRILSVQ